MKLTCQKKIVFPGISLLANTAALPLAGILFLMRHLLKMKMVRIRNSRIGPMAGTDLFLRRITLGKINQENCCYIGFANKLCANQQFFTMLQRKIKIITFPQPKAIRALLQFLACRSLLNRWGLLRELKFNGNEYEELNSSSPSINFTAEEERRGEELLKTLEVEKGKFVCFHARDTAYLDSVLKKRDHRHDFRNGAIENCLPSMGNMTQKGFSALRMGAKVEKKLSTFLDYKTEKKIIDYATRNRSDFGDVYLLAKCRFYLGNTAGLNSIPYVFGIPVASVNVIPITRGPPPGKHDLFIPKKVWSVKEKRYLSFREMIASKEILRWQEEQFKEEDGLIPVENTPEEIQEVVIEMHERLEGRWKDAPEDEKLQQQFKELFIIDPHSDGFPSRIGAKFLRKNRELLRS